MITEITDTALYFRNFLPVGERACSINALGRRSTSRGYLEAVADGDLAEPASARLGRTHLRRAVDGDEPERRAVPERPLEVVEGAPVRVAAHVDTIGQAGQHALQCSRDVLDALLVGGRPDAVLGHQ